MAEWVWAKKNFRLIVMIATDKKVIWIWMFTLDPSFQNNPNIKKRASPKEYGLWQSWWHSIYIQWPTTVNTFSRQHWWKRIHECNYCIYICTCILNFLLYQMARTMTEQTARQNMVNWSICSSLQVYYTGLFRPANTHLSLQQSAFHTSILTKVTTGQKDQFLFPFLLTGWVCSSTFCCCSNNAKLIKVWNDQIVALNANVSNQWHILFHQLNTATDNKFWVHSPWIKTNGWFISSWIAAEDCYFITANSNSELQ